MKVPGVLKNKYVLYILLVIAIVNVLGYLAVQDYNSLALFVVMGLLSSYFSKNMSVNLLVAITVTSFVSINNKVQEGFEGHTEPEHKKEHKQKALQDTIKEISKVADNAGSVAATESCDPACVKGKEECKDGKCVEVGGFQNNVPPSSPAPVNTDSDDSIGDRIDYAATMEQAYNNLQNMLGKDGMKSITEETKKLVSQQKDLMGTLSSMAPVLNSAKETLSGLNLKDMEGMSGILKNLQGGAPPKIKNK
jgi:hypothetical protein